MAVTVPNALALAGIVDGSAIVASDHRNNYSAIQVGANGLIAMFAVAPTKGDLIVSAGGGSFDRLGVGANGQAIIADSTQALGMKWASAGALTYRKTTSKAVNTTTAATDLLNGEITAAAGALGTTGLLRLKAWGDWLQNAGAAAAPPRLQLVFGGTTLFDTSTNAASANNGATRGWWEIEAEILNTGSASAQVASMRALFGLSQAFAAFAAAFTTGDGQYNTVYDGGATLQALAAGVTASAVNTAVASALLLNVINGSASASYETKLFGALVEII